MDNFPENIEEINDEAEIDALIAQIDAAGAELGEQDATDDNVNKLEKLADQKEALEGRRTAIATQGAERASRAEAAKARLADDPEATDVDTDTDGDASLEEGGEVTAEAEALLAETGQPAGATASTETPAPAEVPTGAKGAGQLAARRPGGAAPRDTPTTSSFTATGHAVDAAAGSGLPGLDAIAEQIVAKRHNFGTINAGVREFLPIATGQKTIEHQLTGDVMQNFATMREIQRATPALVASGGSCAPLSPSYEFYRLAEPQNPMEEGTPVAQAGRAGVRYIVPPNVSQAAGAIDISAQDRDYDAAFEQFVEGPKACITVECPETADEDVTAISQCITFDNLNYRVFPEQVAAFLEDVAVQFTSTKEVFYLDYIDSKSVQVTGDFGYGASRSLLRDWTVATVAYRKRHGMRRGAPLTIAAPDWAMDEIRLDLALDGQNGTNMWDVTDAQIEKALSDRGIVPIWYNDNPTGVTPNQKFNAPQLAGALNPFPAIVNAYIYAPGTFVRLDGGSLDVGLVRDSTLNRSNDLQLFMEEWIGMAKMGFESIRLQSTACANGTYPLGVEAFVC